MEEAAEAGVPGLEAGGPGGGHHGLGTEVFETIIERIFIVAEELQRAPDQEAEDAAREQEERQFAEEFHTRTFAILRMIRMPTISETMA